MKELLNHNIFIYQTIVLFGVFAFMGWILETVYRSITNHRFVNAGYLYGPFTPIYGAGGIIVMLVGIFMDSWSIPAQILTFGILTTALELAVGICIEKIFGYRLWSYDGYWMNYKGVICPLYGLIWAVISWAAYYFIFPVTYISISRIPDVYVRIASASAVLYLAADFTLSTLSMLDFSRRIRELYSGFAAVSNVDIQNLSTRFSRIIAAFPDLNLFVERVIHDGVTGRINTILSKIAASQKKSGSARSRKPAQVEPEYLDIVRDIMENEEFRKLANFSHHSTSILEHARYVSYLSYKIAKSLRMDYRSAARGGLLHDFFLYDWHTHDEPDLAKDRNH
ncbi:MAG: putative ABC transporter permease, partial [Spirochaetota bacterium]